MQFMRLASVIVVFLLQTVAHGQVDEAIYSDSLLNGWLDYSWAARNLANSAPVHNGSNSISVTASNYQALYFHHTPLNTALYSNLTFWASGGTNRGQRFQVQALTNGHSLPPVSLLPLTTNWQQFNIPLAALGVANTADMDGIWIQNVSNAPQPVIFVDDVKISARAPPALINVAISATQVLQRVDARMFGLNAAVWDSAFDTANTSALLREIDNQALRFPGGSASDDYHWSSNTSGTNTWTWATSFDKFAHTATNVHAQAFITVNYGGSGWQEASNWVRYANVTKRYGFKYWEIGNENYGRWENDTNSLPNDPFTYATRARDYFKAMKAADPSIQIGVVAVTGEDAYANGYTNHTALNPRTGQRHNGWTPVMLTTLKALGVTPDYLIYHKYAQNPGNESDGGLLQSSRTWAGDAADLRRQLTDYLGSDATNATLVCTENNSVSSAPGKQTTSIVNALFHCDSLGQALQTEFRSLIWWDLRNGQDGGNNNSANLYGWRAYGDYGVVSDQGTRYPTFYAEKLLKYFARGGDKILAAASDYPLLSAYACLRTNGALAVLLINKSSINSLNASVVTGRTNDTHATLYSYGVTQDEAGRTGVGSPDVAKTNIVLPPTNFQVSVPAYTALVIALPPPAPRLSILPTPAPNLNSVQIQLRGETGSRYLVEQTRDVDASAWSPFATTILAGPLTNWTDSASAARRFYRSQWLP